jgi:hypothetical protein
VIAPIGDLGSDIRKRSDQILKHIIAPACEECGYDEPIRADKIAAPGVITTQIIQHLIDDAIVIADLTDHNANVFYELAIRHAFRKHVIQLIQTGQTIPFDVAGLRTVFVDHRDLDSAAEAKRSIIGHMKAIQEHPAEVDSPISVAVDREALRSGTTQERELALMFDGITNLTNLVSRLRDDVGRLHTGSETMSERMGDPDLHNLKKRIDELRRARPEGTFFPRHGKDDQEKM